jgi:glycolate oxidase iron-sulfur subunit
MLRKLVFDHLLPSRTALKFAGAGLAIYQRSGLQSVVRAVGLIPRGLRDAESLAPVVETPFFFRDYGRVFPARGERRYRVAFLGGCIANLAFARLNEATVRVLQANGCEVHVHAAQTCCGALHVHAGLRERARRLARRNIDAVLDGGFDAGFDAIITNAGGCGSTLKEYGELLEHDQTYAEKARRFSSLVKDVNEFLASIELNLDMKPLSMMVTYQDSCHLAHGQKIRSAPRKLLNAVPGLQLREMPLSDLCCGSAGIYNVVHTGMSMALLRKKMDFVNGTGAQAIVTANPGCMLQLAAGVQKFGQGQRVAHVVQILDEAYSQAKRAT